MGRWAKRTIFTFDEKDAVVLKAVDEAALLEELKAFGIGGNANLMTYNGQFIRYFVDGVPVGDNGYSIQYVYSNPDGVVDVHTLRSVIHNPDGSYNPMGELNGLAVEGDSNFNRDLIESAAFSGGIRATTAEGTSSDVALAGDFRIERNDDQTTPDTIVGRTDARQVVGIQNQRVTRLEGEWVLIFFLHKHIICRAELLHGGVVQAGAFLHFRCNEQTLAFDFSHFRLDISAASNGQGVSGAFASQGQERHRHLPVIVAVPL